jgi:hypothetical protein
MQNQSKKHIFLILRTSIEPVKEEKIELNQTVKDLLQKIQNDSKVDSFEKYEKEFMLIKNFVQKTIFKSKNQNHC